MTETIVSIVKKEFHLRVIEESLSRIKQCVNLLSDEQLWHSENDNTNSVGNLVLHLEGNIRQYIISGVGGAKDVRERTKEFEKGQTLLKEPLIEKLSSTLNQADEVVQALLAEHLTEGVMIQGFEHTRLSAIIHVIEHLSYHVGQITFYTKYILDIDTSYYGGMDLDVTA